MKLSKITMFILLFCVFSVSGCTSKEETIKVLSSQGYTNIEVKGYSFFGCSEDDWYHTKFTAVSSANGKTISGVVCSGFLLKGSTVRFK